MKIEDVIKLRDEYKLKEAHMRKKYAPSQGAKTPGEYFGFMEAFDLIIAQLQKNQSQRANTSLSKDIYVNHHWPDLCIGIQVHKWPNNYLVFISLFFWTIVINIS